MAKTTEIVVIKEAEAEAEAAPKQQPITNLFSLFPKLNLQLPFLNPKPKPDDKPSIPNKLNHQQECSKPNVVRFPKTQVIVPPSLEAEPDADQFHNKNSNPLVRWQIYALGGFLISRWIWARWSERRARGNSSNDEGRQSGDGRRSSDNE
ncbi:uncharacterized protein LOC133294650 [Gastrolobium bilobum]|uniref:uncharacterized protein LOC133294650 n=1 Tax=Gastrolobium bilobum TaxID=150636 RepID=UPI002AB08E3D|nr:uncharacterized protein LOC133294650 [Gastrolobium bilobum]